jgi:hypothetical protein
MFEDIFIPQNVKTDILILKWPLKSSAWESAIKANRLSLNLMKSSLRNKRLDRFG